MTCEEFRRMIKKRNPSQCTVAECTATILHAASCPACDQWLEDEAERATGEVGPLTPKEELEAKLVAVRCLLDPECPKEIYEHL